MLSADGDKQRICAKSTRERFLFFAILVETQTADLLTFGIEIITINPTCFPAERDREGRREGEKAERSLDNVLEQPL